MSLDRSLKTHGALDQHRNVLTRPERIAKMKDQGRFKEGDNDPIHLPKIANRKIAAGKKAGKKKDDDES